MPNPNRIKLYASGTTLHNFGICSGGGVLFCIYILSIRYVFAHVNILGGSCIYETAVVYAICLVFSCRLCTWVLLLGCICV